MNFVDFQLLKCISLVGGLKGLLVRVSIVKRIESRFYNPIKESSGSFSNRNLEIFGILEIIFALLFYS